MKRFQEIDQFIAGTMQQWGIPAVRLSFAVIFIWFGLLKPMGLSAAAPLVLATVDWMPLLSAETWLSVIGWWEVVIGICFLFQSTLRIAIVLLFLQMVGTFMPLVILSGVTFQEGLIPFGPTVEGQYIIKNLMIISAALVVGGSLSKRTQDG